MLANTPEEVTTLFLESMASGNTETALELVDPDIVYTNVSLPTVRGKARTAKIIRALDGARVGFRVRLITVAADGDTVLTERIDELRFGKLRAQFWVVGRFEVRDGRITVWRDYFDWFDVTKGMLRGVAALAVPGLQKPLPAPGETERVG
jgi:limonene-1,2-epoxide hydrolase